MKDSLARLGIPSAFAALVAVVWLIGTTPVQDGMPIVQYWHQHAINAINKPTPMDLAVNDKVDIQEFVQGYEFQLIEHEKTLDKIKERFNGDPSDLMIEMKKYDSKQKRIGDKLQDWRNRATENRVEIKMLLAGTSAPT